MNKLRHSRESKAAIELPKVPERKWSVEKYKRLEELRLNNNQKHMPKIDHLKINCGINKLQLPPRPEIMKKAIKNYNTPSPIIQAGLAVLGTPQNYLPAINPIGYKVLM